MKNSPIAVVVILLLAPLFSFSQITIKGVVRDETTQEPLPFATLGFNDFKNGTICNKDGCFTITINTLPIELTVHYMGYESCTIKVEKPDGVVVQLKQATHQLKSVEINGNEAEELLFNAIHKAEKEKNKVCSSKVFYRQINDKNGTDFLSFQEAFFQAELTNSRVKELELKNGRMGYIGRFATCNFAFIFNFLSFIQGIPLFDEPSNSNDFPQLPFYKTKREIKNNYSIWIADKFSDQGREIAEVCFQPKKDTLLNFKGSIFIDRNDFSPLKIKATGYGHLMEAIKPEDTIPLESVTIEVGLHPGMAMDYIKLDFKEKIKHPSGTIDFINNTNTFLFYDYQQKFNMPIGDIYAWDDLSKMTCLPYNDIFWQKNMVLSESPTEERARKYFEKENFFTDSRRLGVIQAINPNINSAWINPVLEWKNLQTLNWLEILKDRYADTLGRQVAYKMDEIQNKSQDPLERIHIDASIFFDYDCYPDTNVYLVKALFEARLSYCPPDRRDSATLAYINNIFNITEIYARKLLAELHKGKNKCLPRKEAQEIYERITSDMEKEKWNYRVESKSGQKQKEQKEWTEKICRALNQ